MAPTQKYTWTFTFLLLLGFRQHNDKDNTAIKLIKLYVLVPHLWHLCLLPLFHISKVSNWLDLSSHTV